MLVKTTLAHIRKIIAVHWPPVTMATSYQGYLERIRWCSAILQQSLREAGVTKKHLHGVHTPRHTHTRTQTHTHTPRHTHTHTHRERERERVRERERERGREPN